MNRIPRTLRLQPAKPCSRHNTRAVLCLDTPDSPDTGTAPLSLPSPELLDRARVGWECFLATFEEAADE